LVALGLVYRSRFPQHDLWAVPFVSSATEPATGTPHLARDMPRLARDFVFTILVVQTAAIFLLTLAYVAGAVAEERERGTLDLLLTTHLRDREIVLGKLGSRLVQAGSILLAGLPLLALTQLWGGVDFRLLSVAFLVAVLNLATIGAIAVWISARAPTTAAALGASYWAVAGFAAVSLALFATPAGTYSLLSWGVGSQPDAFLYILPGVLLHLVAVAVGASGAVRSLRASGDRPGRTVKAAAALTVP
jgi:ABC-type transport system involved in multi-copper enzyme maturation permease subunit